MAIGKRQRSGELGEAPTRYRFLGGGAGAPKRAPGLQGLAAEALLVSDIRSWTVTRRAAELGAPPKRFGVYLGGRKPSVAMRLPGLILEAPNQRRVRETIVARSRVLRTVNNRPQP